MHMHIIYFDNIENYMIFVITLLCILKTKKEKLSKARLVVLPYNGSYSVCLHIFVWSKQWKFYVFPQYYRKIYVDTTHSIFLFYNNSQLYIYMIYKCLVNTYVYLCIGRLNTIYICSNDTKQKYMLYLYIITKRWEIYNHDNFVGFEVMYISFSKVFMFKILCLYIIILYIYALHFNIIYTILSLFIRTIIL